MNSQYIIVYNKVTVKNTDYEDLGTMSQCKQVELQSVSCANCNVLWAILHFDGGVEDVFIKAQHVLVSAGEVLAIVLCNVIFTAF